MDVSIDNRFKKESHLPVSQWHFFHEIYIIHVRICDMNLTLGQPMLTVLVTITHFLGSFLKLSLVFF